VQFPNKLFGYLSRDFVYRHCPCFPHTILQNGRSGEAMGNKLAIQMHVTIIFWKRLTRHLNSFIMQNASPEMQTRNALLPETDN